MVAPHGPFKKVLYGRGAGNKGAFMGFLNALESIKAAAGELPVNLMFVSEGEEFVGSDHIPLLIDRYRHHLSKADAAIVAGACQTASGDVSLFLGNKGNLHIELECSGDRWGKGPAGGPVHSSAQPVVDHPVWRMVKALATLYDPEENRVLVDGFYDDLEAPTEEDLELIDGLAERYKGQEGSAIPSLAPGNVGSVSWTTFPAGTLFLRYCFQPTMNINGLRAGYTGPGTLLWDAAQRCLLHH